MGFYLNKAFLLNFVMSVMASNKGADIVFLVFLFILNGSVNGDTPANCTHDNLIGKWKFYFSSGGHDKHIDCLNPGVVTKVIPMTFSSYSTVVKDTDGELGHF